MATFKYIAKNKDSHTVAGKITAETKTAVIEELRKRQLIIISIDEIKTVDSGSKGKPLHVKGVKAEEIVIFTRQLATIVEAGIPVMQGIDALQEQVTHRSFKKVLANIRDDIQQGASLYAAFAKHTGVFDTIFISMIKVGEAGGVLGKILDRVASYMEKALRLQRKVKSAMVYPIVVVSMAILITVFLLVKVVPMFVEIFASLGRELPAMTQLLINISDTLKNNFAWIVGILVLSIVGLKQLGKTSKGGLIIDRALLRLPIFGELLRKVAISRFSRTMATLIQSGVPIMESLDIVAKTIGNRVLVLVIEEVKTAVREGESLAGPLGKSKVFPPMVTRMIAIGEKSGKLDQMLLKIAEFYDEQVDAAVDGLTSIIEPLIIGFLGIVIGFIVIALFLPILSMTKAL